MRRMSSAAGDQLDPRELIARITAEHDSPSGRTVSTGRHHATTAPPVVHVPAARTGAHRVPDDGVLDDAAVPRPARAAVPAPRPPDRAPDPGQPDDGSLVEIDREVAGRRSRVRRLAPLGLGAAVVLAATMVFTLLQPGAEDPDLGAALANDSSRRASSDTSAIPTGPSADTGARTLSGVTSGAGDQVGAARAAQALQAQQAAKRNAEQRAAAQASGPSTPRASRPVTGGAPAAGVAQVAGDGVQAALKLGWGAVGGDEFAGGALGDGWTAYDGPGHAGNGRRTPDAVSVENGNLVIRGDSQGNTGGIAFGDSQKYGKWEMRARFPKGDAQYHPVLLLWPTEVEWPRGGEIDFAETNSAADDVSFFLHYGSSNSQDSAKKALDLTQWHNYAVEWTPDGIRGYIDGVKWFENTDPSTQPPGPMHATIQLDYFPDGGSPQPSELQVAWMRQYK